VRLILRSIRERTLSVITDSIRYAAGIRTGMGDSDRDAQDRRMDWFEWEALLE